MLSRPKRGANGAGPSAGASAGAGVNGGGASTSGRSGRPRTANSKPGRSAGMGSGAGSVGMVVYDDTGREDPLTRAMAPPPNETCVPSSSSLPSSGLLLTFAFSVPPRCVFELRRRARKQRRRAPRAARGRARGEAHLGPHRRGAEPPARRGAQGSAARQDSVARCVYFPD